MPAPRTTLLLLILLCSVHPLAAQVRSLAVTSENDAYNFWIPFAIRPDQEYTNGMELAAELEGAPLWGRLLRGRTPCGADSAGACLSTRVRFGQKIFNPRTQFVRPGQRPYAGWLYLGAAAAVERPLVRRSADVEIGVTGPPSQGEWVQATVHDIAGFRPVPGWRDQLRTEPGIVLRYGEEHLIADVRPGGVPVADVVPFWGATAGNVVTGAHGGVRLRAGYGVPAPWGRTPRRGPVALYAVAGVRAELVLRDLFLDGNTFRDGPRVKRIPTVGQLEVGGGVRLGPVGLEYRAITRTPSYRTEPTGHQYGSFQVTINTKAQR